MPIIDRYPLSEGEQEPYLITEIMDGLNKELARNARRKRRHQKRKLATLEQMRWLFAIPDFGEGEDAIDEDEDIPESEEVAAATAAELTRPASTRGWTTGDRALVGIFFILSTWFVAAYVAVNW